MEHCRNVLRLLIRRTDILHFYSIRPSGNYDLFFCCIHFRVNHHQAGYSIEANHCNQPPYYICNFLISPPSIFYLETYVPFSTGLWSYLFKPLFFFHSQLRLFSKNIANYFFLRCLIHFIKLYSRKILVQGWKWGI